MDENYKSILVDLPQGSIEFPQIYLNQIYALKKLKLTNDTNEPVTVNLSSTLSSQIFFQKENAIYVDDRAPQSYNDNQLYNEINRTDSIDFLPQETKYIYMSFLPLLEGNDLKKQHHSSKAKDNQEETYHYFCTVGEIKFQTVTTNNHEFSWVVPFKTNICYSCFQTNCFDKVFNMHDVFDDNEISLDNCSDIDLFWEILYFGPDPNFRETVSFIAVHNQKDSWSGRLSGGSSIKLKICVDQNLPKNSILSFVIRNKYNPKNRCYFNIETKSNNRLYEKDLISLNPPVVEFYDCYNGKEYVHNMDIENESRFPVKLYFVKDVLSSIRIKQKESSEIESANNKSISSIPNLDFYNILNATHNVGSVLSPSLTKTMEHPSDSPFLGLEKKEVFVYEFVLKPKSKKSLDLCFIPYLDPLNPEPSRLCRRKEELKIYHKIQPINNISLNYLNFEQHWKPKVVDILYSSCTSVIDVIPKTLDFGENEVETYKTKLMLVTNLSDLITTAQIELQSKIIKASETSFVIEPRSSAQVEFTIIPKKPNPEYKKPLMVKNAMNTSNIENVTISSKNLDTKKISLHNSFYAVKSVDGKRVIDYGNTTVGFLKISNLVLENISNKEITLQLYTSKPEDSTLYSINTKKTSSSELTQNIYQEDVSNNKNFYETKLSERVLETLDPEISTSKDQLRSTINNQKLSSLSKKLEPIRKISHKSASYLDLALNKTTNKPSEDKKTDSIKPKAKSPTEKSSDLSSSSKSSSVDNKFLNSENKKRMTSRLENIEATLSLQNVKKNSFTEESDYVKSVFQAKKELESIIKEEHVTKIDKITLMPGEKFHFLLVFDAKEELMINVSQNKMKKYNSKIMIKLIDVDRSINTRFSELLHGDLSKIVPYEIPIKANICHSRICILQKSLNYGNINKNKTHSNFIALRNKTDVPLLYSIHKSGSIASGSIAIDSDKYGIIREHAKKYVNYTFCPKVSGKFEETVLIKNILSEKDTQSIRIKAFVNKPPSFSIRSISDYFGPCFVNKISLKRCEVEITNASKSSKTLEIRVDPSDLDFGRCYGELHFFLPPQSETQKILSEEDLEKIESLEQKLKIAIRKGNNDKSDKIRESLAKLRNGETEHSTKDEVLNTSPNDAIPESTKNKNIPVVCLKRKSNTSLLINMAPNSKAIVCVWFYPILSNLYENIMPNKSREFVSCQIYVHEPKIKDNSNLVVFKSYICYDFASYKNGILHETDESFKKDILRNKYNSSNSNFVLKPDSYLNSKSLDDFSTKGARALGIEIQKTISNCLGFPSQLILGKYEINKTNEFYLDLKNDCSFAISFAVKISSPRHCMIKLKNDHCVEIDSNSSHKLYFTFESSKIGPLQIDISFEHKNSGNIMGTSTVYTYIHCSKYLNFPVFKEDEEQLLDLGYCYIDTFKKYSQVTPLLIENITSHLLTIDCESNLKQQVTVFMDEFGKKGNVKDMLILPRSKTTIWVAIQHGLSVNELSLEKKIENPENTKIARDLDTQYKHCRQLIGGLKFSIKVEATSNESQERYENSIYFTQILKFSAFVGESMLEVDPGILNILVSSKNKTLYGGFSLNNKSDLMPAEFKLESQNNVVKLDRSKGYISSKSYYKSVYEDELHEYDNGKRIIGFKVPTPKPGLMIDYINIINMNNSRQKLKVEVRVFMDSNKLLCKQIDESFNSENSSDEEHHFYDSSQPLRSLPIIKWDDVMVKTRSDDSLNESKNISMFIDTKDGSIDKIIEITNVSEKQVELLTKSDILIKTKWISCTKDMQLHKNSEEPYKNSENDGFEYHGPRVFLNKGEKVSLVVCCPSPFSLPKEALERLRSGKKGHLKGVIVINDAISKTDLKMFEMISNYRPQKL